MSRRSRHTSLFARALGVILLIPGLLQVPLPEADFHIIRHSHGAGEVCPHHDHLLRWHPQAGEGEAVAVLHWHWLLPKSLDPSALDASSRAIPSLHAHDTDHDGLGNPEGPVLTREDRGREFRSDVASVLGLSLLPAVWAPPAPPPRSAIGSSGLLSDVPGTSTAALSRLVRWNC